MPNEIKDNENRSRRHHSYRTGEDIDMLNERRQEEGNYSSGSDSYKDNIDGA